MSPDRPAPGAPTPDEAATDDRTQPLPEETVMSRDETTTTEHVPIDAPRAEPAPTTASVAPDPQAAPRRRVRSATVVWGLVLAAVGVGLLAAAAGVQFDVQLALIVLIAVAGAALLVSSLTGGRRRR